MFKRNQRKSDTDLRGRRSLDAVRALGHARSSEQIPRQQLSVQQPSRSPARPTTPDRPPRSPNAQSPQSPQSPQSLSLRIRPSPRFSLLRSRNASDPALGMRVKHDPNPPPLPSNLAVAPPAIITTSPTNDVTSTTAPAPAQQPLKRSGTMRLWKRIHDRDSDKQDSSSMHSNSTSHRSSLSTRRLREFGGGRNNSSMRLSRVTFDEHNPRPSVHVTQSDPPPYEDANSSLPIPPPRLSESSRSTASSGEHAIGFQTTTTTHTTTTTTFFKLPRRKRKDQPLFPLPSKPSETVTSTTSTLDPEAVKQREQRRCSTASNVPTGASPVGSDRELSERPTSAMTAGSAVHLSSPGPPLTRSTSMQSGASGTSGPSSPKRGLSVRRGRSSTMSSIDQAHKALVKGGGLGMILGRIRRDSEPMFGQISRSSSPQPQSALSQPALSAPGSTGASRSSHDVFIPERHDEDTPQAYLSKLLGAVSKSVVASLLARSGDPFHLAVLKVYMQTFNFTRDPMDMALRKLLMEVELPSETQQIDRVLQAFADRYHECNEEIYKDEGEAYFIAFSLIMLHTDFYNRNNRHKMQKADYVKNTKIDDGLADEILECFYANITYTPFIRMEDEYDINGEKIVSHRPKKGIFHRTVNHYDGRRLKEPIDPYLLIIDNQLDLLRSNLENVLHLDNPYTFYGTAPQRLDVAALYKSFSRSCVLQIMSPKSRPEAFLTQETVDNPEGASPGIVEIKVTKVGILWRKEEKKKMMGSPWQEWGAMLTGSKLYLFRSVGWIKSLMAQYEQHYKGSDPGTPVVFRPPVPSLNPDHMVSTEDAIALFDRKYKKHKNAFAFVRHGNVPEFLLAESEAEMNDWVAKLNYAAAFRTSGVRMRGVVGGNYEGQRSRGIRRMDSNASSPATSSVQTPSGEVSIVRGNIDSRLLADIYAARREQMMQRIVEWEERIARKNRELWVLLRNARHLMILTPIQPRTREQVIMAAGSLAANLQWKRIEMKKLECYREILAKDMEEERKSMRDFDRRVQNMNMSSPPSSSGGLRITPVSSTQSPPVTAEPVGTGLSPMAAIRPSSAQSDAPSLRPTPSHRTTPSQDFASSPASERPPRDFASSSHLRSPSACSRGRHSISAADLRIDADARSHRSPSPAFSDSSFRHTCDRDDDVDDKDKKKEKKEKKDKEKEPGRSSTIRKSLQRTLRDSPALGHKRNKSTDDPSAEKKDKVSSPSEGLPRVEGSFTVHGKKASVITFGSEWQNIMPEERLRRHVTRSEADANDNESLSSFMQLSRRASEATTRGMRMLGDEGLLAGGGLSRRGSHATQTTPAEEIPEVPEVPGMEGKGVKETAGTVTMMEVEEVLLDGQLKFEHPKVEGKGEGEKVMLNGGLKVQHPKVEEKGKGKEVEATVASQDKPDEKETGTISH